MASVSRQLSPAFVPSVSQTSRSPSHFKCHSNPPSPNYLQPNFFDFDSRHFQSAPQQQQQRPTSASRFGRQSSSPRLSFAGTQKSPSQSPTPGNATAISRSLSPSAFPHGSLSPIANHFPRERQLLSPQPQTAVQVGQSAHLKGQDPSQSSGKSGSPSRNQPWKKYFRVTKSPSAPDTKCAHLSTTGSKSTFDRKHLERSSTVEFGPLSTRSSTSVRMSFSRTRGRGTTQAKPPLSKDDRLEESNSLDLPDRDPIEPEKPESDANHIKDHKPRRPSSVSLRQRLALLRDSLSLDSPDLSTIRCQDFGIRDYLSRTNESIDNEEESSLAGDINAGLGILPPRFSVDSLDSHLSFLLELNEKKDALLPLARSPSISKGQTVRRKSDEIGMRRKMSVTAVTRDSGAQPETYSHGEYNNVVASASATTSGATVRILRKSNSLPYTGTLRALPKIQESTFTIVGMKAPLVQEFAGASTSDADSHTLQDRYPPGTKFLSKEKGTIEELDDDEDWKLDDCVVTIEDDYQEEP